MLLFMSFGFSLMVSAVTVFFFFFFIVENCVYDFDFAVNHILIFLIFDIFKNCSFTTSFEWLKF